MEDDEPRSRSFRHEDYDTRRVFLRSYPLHWGPQSEEAGESTGRAAAAAEFREIEEPARGVGDGRKRAKKMILRLVGWRERRALVFKRLKQRIAILVVNCVPDRIKAPSSLVTVI